MRPRGMGFYFAAFAYEREKNNFSLIRKAGKGSSSGYFHLQTVIEVTEE
jgi:hypothetical protein